MASEEEYNQIKTDDFFIDIDFDAKSMPLTKDDEFKELIPKISQLEYKQLEKILINPFQGDIYG